MSFHGKGYWAIILGGSSGFGLATAKKVGSHGMNVCIVHRDRRAAAAQAQTHFEEIKAQGVDLLSFYIDALSADGRSDVIREFAAKVGTGRLRLLMHSIAFGNLKPLVAQKREPGTADAEEEFFLGDDDFTNTVHAMGTSLASWVQDAFKHGLFHANSRVIGLTSEGNEVAWRGYAAVSAAKCALEAVSRSIAFEFAPFGIRSNILQPGVTDTPALRMIPGNEAMKDKMLKKNPMGRLTTPEDVANVIHLLCHDEASWINGSLIRVDGGEHIAG